jgi:bifunctional non-homologous end joining protein LigD
LRVNPLGTERKRVLQSLLSEWQAQRIFYSEHFEDGTDLYARATEMKLEGIVSKTGNAPYRSGRCEHWLKVKCWRRDRFVVVGFVPEGSSGLPSAGVDGLVVISDPLRSCERMAL